MRTALTVLFLLALLAATTGVALWAWQAIDDTQISRHGLIALGLGAGLSFIVGAGLMALLFFSSRRGYDDRAHRFEEHRRRDDSDSDDG